MGDSQDVTLESPLETTIGVDNIETLDKQEISDIEYLEDKAAIEIEEKPVKIAEKGKRRKFVKKKLQSDVLDSSDESSTESEETPKKKERATEDLNDSKIDGKATPSTKPSQLKIKDKMKKEEDKPVFKVNLKKSAPIKRPIKEKEIEKIQLKHHEFERQPQEPEAEKSSDIRITVALSQIKGENDDKTEKKKKVMKKKKKKAA